MSASDPNEPISSDLVREDPSFADLVTSFVEGLSRRLSDMEKAVAESDFDALRVAAHQLKGSAGGYGYPQLTEKAASLEGTAQQQVIDACSEELDGLRNLIARVVVSGD